MSACGQIDTVNVPIWDSGSGLTLTDSGYLIISNSSITTTPTLSISQFDTVKCIMLVCDTALRYLIINDYNTSIVSFDVKGQMKSFGYKQDTLNIYHSNYIYWQYGYELVNTDKDMYGGYQRNYLDENKKPLSESIVVWQSIKAELNNSHLYIGKHLKSENMTSTTGSPLTIDVKGNAIIKQ